MNYSHSWSHSYQKQVNFSVVFIYNWHLAEYFPRNSLKMFKISVFIAAITIPIATSYPFDEPEWNEDLVENDIKIDDVSSF